MKRGETAAVDPTAPVSESAIADDEVHDDRASALELKGATHAAPCIPRRRAHEGGLMSEATGRFKIVNQLGLHARAATKLVQLASKYPCDVEVARDDQSANARA